MTLQENMEDAVRKVLKEERDHRTQLIRRELFPLVNTSLGIVFLFLVATAMVSNHEFESTDMALVAMLIILAGTLLSVGIWMIHSYVATNQGYIEEIMKKLDIS